jgi:hypothetical protein
MSALQQAISELEDYRKGIEQIIDGLRRVTGALGYPASPVVAPVQAPQALPAPAETTPVHRRSVKRPALAPKVASKAKSDTISAPLTPSPTALLAQRVLAFISARGAVRAKELQAALKTTSYKLKTTLNDLRADKRLVLTGTRASARWSIPATTKLTTTAKAGPAVETVWNGTKDHDRTAPSLIGSER